jgi:hypothetical protein
MKIAINSGIGSFDLSKEGKEYFYKLQNITPYFFNSIWNENEDKITYIPYKPVEYFDSFETFNVPNPNDFDIENPDVFNSISLDIWSVDRTNKFLIQTIEDLKEKTNHNGCEPKVIEIPDDVDWIIQTTEMGQEYIAEKHRTWY